MEVRYSTVELWPYLQAAWRQLSRFLKTKNESKLNKNQTKSEKVNRTNLNQRTHRITERKDWQQICPKENKNWKRSMSLTWPTLKDNKLLLEFVIPPILQTAQINVDGEGLFDGQGAAVGPQVMHRNG